MKNGYILFYIALGAVVVLLLWQTRRMAAEVTKLKQDLVACRDTLTAIPGAVTHDTVWVEYTTKEYVNVAVPTPVYVVDTFFVQPSFARYEDSIALDSAVTLFYRLNINGALLSHGYRYRAVLPEITHTETIYLPGKQLPAPRWGAYLGAAFTFDPASVSPGAGITVTYGNLAVGYQFTGRHGVSLMYGVRF